MTISTFITSLPMQENQPLFWWYFDEHGLVAEGCDEDPLLAAGLKMPSMADEELKCMALVPASASIVRWHPALESTTPKQAKAAARLSVLEDSIQATELHIAANVSPSGIVATAAVGRDVIRHGLEMLNRLGIDPDYVLPAGWIIPPSDDEIVEVDFGFESLLRGPEFILPNEPAFRDQMTAGQAIKPLDEVALRSALTRATERTGLNLRSGDFARRSRARLSDSNKRKLAWLVTALVVVSLAIPLARWAQYSWAAHSTNVAALTSAGTVVGPVDDIAAANKLLDDQLAARNIGNHPFSVAGATLFSAVQKSPGVSIEQLSYDNSGITTATLAAVRNEDINPALMLVQKAGFLITATPRTDATGTAKADITVRMP